MPPTPTGLEEVLEGLRDIARHLEQTPQGAFEERLELLERRRELRIRAAELGAAARTPEMVSEELQQLRRLRDDIFERHLSVGQIGGGNGPGGGGIEPRYVFALNRTIDENWGRADLERRIQELEVELARLHRG